MKKPIIACTIVAVLLAIGVPACNEDSKIMQGYQNAPVNKSDRNTGPASIGTMPDGFPNYATKCDHGNRVYGMYHGDGAYGDIEVVANDPTCKK